MGGPTASLNTEANRETSVANSGVPRAGGGSGVQTSPEIPKALQNRAKTEPDLWKLLNISEFRMPTPQDVRKKGSKILKQPRFPIFLH